jgi:hypothetical protein
MQKKYVGTCQNKASRNFKKEYMNKVNQLFLQSEILLRTLSFYFWFIDVCKKWTPMHVEQIKASIINAMLQKESNDIKIPK